MESKIQNKSYYRHQRKVITKMWISLPYYAVPLLLHSLSQDSYLLSIRSNELLKLPFRRHSTPSRRQSSKAVDLIKFISTMYIYLLLYLTNELLKLQFFQHSPRSNKLYTLVKIIYLGRVKSVLLVRMRSKKNGIGDKLERVWTSPLVG